MRPALVPVLTGHTGHRGQGARPAGRSWWPGKGSCSSPDPGPRVSGGTCLEMNLHTKPSMLLPGSRIAHKDHRPTWRGCWPGPGWAGPESGTRSASECSVLNLFVPVVVLRGLPIAPPAEAFPGVGCCPSNCPSLAGAQSRICSGVLAGAPPAA